MYLIDILCCLGVTVTCLGCYKLHCGHHEDSNKVVPWDTPRKASIYEMEIYNAHMNLYGNKSN